MADMNGEGPEFVDTDEGPSLRYKGKWLYSQRAPVSRAIAVLGNLPIQEECLYLVPSPCLCHGLPALLQRLPASSAILAVEIDQALYDLALTWFRTHIASNTETTYTTQDLARTTGFSHTDHTRAARIAFHKYENDELLFSAVNRLGKFRRVAEVRLSSGWTLAPDIYEALPGKILEYFSEYYRSRMTAVRMGRLWLRNTIKNIVRLPERPAPMPSTNKPVAVCGAGLSLYRALPWLTTERERLYLIACDTAFGTLRAAGIMPDSIVCLDAQLYNILDLIGYDKTTSSVHAFVELSAHPSFFQGFLGSITPVLTGWSKSSLMESLARSGYGFVQMPPLGSVGLSSLYLAAKLGSPVIYLTGLDFSYLPGYTHAPSTLMDSTESERETRLYRREASWAQSFRQGSLTVLKGLRTDPALEMYANLCCDLIATISSTCELVDIRGDFGLDLGLVRHEPSILGNPAGKSSNVTTGSKACVSDNIPGIADADTSCSTTHEKLRGILEQYYNDITQLRQELRDGAERNVLLAHIQKLDFLFIHFPDSDRVLSLEQDSLNRLAFECEYWAGKISMELQRH